MNESSWLGLGLGLFVAAFAAGAADVADFITDVIAAAAADAAAATASIASLFLSINKSNYLFFFVVPPKWATLHYTLQCTYHSSNWAVPCALHGFHAGVHGVH